MLITSLPTNIFIYYLYILPQFGFVYELIAQDFFTHPRPPSFPPVRKLMLHYGIACRVFEHQANYNCRKIKGILWLCSCRDDSAANI